MGTFFRNKTNYNMSAVIGGVALAELLEGAATVWTAGQVLKDNYNEISSAAAVGMGYRGIGSIFGRNPNSTIDSTQLAAVQHLKKIIAVAGEPIPVGSYTNTKNMQPFIALAKAALKAANKLDKNKKTMISQAITAFPLIHFNSDGSTGERTGNTSMQRAALGELGWYMGKEVDIHPFAMLGRICPASPWMGWWIGWRSIGRKRRWRICISTRPRRSLLWGFIGKRDSSTARPARLCQLTQPFLAGPASRWSCLSRLQTWRRR